MKPYRAEVFADKWPYRVSVEASSWPTAAARATREWQKRFKGSRTETLTIKIVRGGVK